MKENQHFFSKIKINLNFGGFLMSLENKNGNNFEKNNKKTKKQKNKKKTKKLQKSIKKLFHDFRIDKK